MNFKKIFCIILMITFIMQNKLLCGSEVIKDIFALYNGGEYNRVINNIDFLLENKDEPVKDLLSYLKYKSLLKLKKYGYIEKLYEKTEKNKGMLSGRGIYDKLIKLIYFSSLVQSGRYDKFRKRINELDKIEINDEFKAVGYTKKILSGDYDDGILFLKGILEKKIFNEDINLKIRLLLGNIFIKINRKEEAAKIYNEILKSKMQDNIIKKVIFNLAYIEYLKSNFKTAIEQYKKLLKKGITGEYEQDIIFIEIAKCYMKRLEFENAVRYLESVKNKDRLYETYLWLGQSYMETGELEKAKKNLYSCAEFKKDLKKKIFANILLSVLEARTNNFTKAVKILRENFGLIKYDSSLLHDTIDRFFKIYYNLSRYNIITDLNEDIVMKYPDIKYRTESLIIIGESYYNTNNCQTAVNIFKRIIKKHKDYYLIPRVKQDLVKCYIRLAKYDRAEVLLEDLRTDRVDRKWVDFTGLEIKYLKMGNDIHLIKQVERIALNFIDNDMYNGEKEYIYYILGEVWKRKRGYSIALDYFNRITIDNESLYLLAKSKIIEIYLKQKKYEKAKKYYDELNLSKVSENYAADIINKLNNRLLTENIFEIKEIRKEGEDAYKFVLKKIIDKYKNRKEDVIELCKVYLKKYDNYTGYVKYLMAYSYIEKFNFKMAKNILIDLEKDKSTEIKNRSLYLSAIINLFENDYESAKKKLLRIDSKKLEITALKNIFISKIEIDNKKYYSAEHILKNTEFTTNKDINFLILYNRFMNLYRLDNDNITVVYNVIKENFYSKEIIRKTSFLMAKYYYDRKNFVSAANMITEVFGKNLRYTEYGYEPYFILAGVYSKLKQYNESNEILNQILRSADEGYYNRIRLKILKNYCGIGDFKQAEQIFSDIEDNSSLFLLEPGLSEEIKKMFDKKVY